MLQNSTRRLKKSIDVSVSVDSRPYHSAYRHSLPPAQPRITEIGAEHAAFPEHMNAILKTEYSAFPDLGAPRGASYD